MFGRIDKSKGFLFITHDLASFIGATILYALGAREDQVSGEA